MMRDRDDHRVDFNKMREQLQLQKLQGVVTELIDFSLAVAAMNMEAEHFTHEQLFKMESIIKDARRKLGSSFTIEDGMKAVRAAFRIELQSEGKEKGL